MKIKDKFMSIEEVAEHLNVNYQLIYRLVRSLELPAVRIGRVYRIKSSDLEKYLEQSKSKPVSHTVCKACGKTYTSNSSLNHQCIECNALICTDCWERKNIHTCSKHSQ